MNTAKQNDYASRVARVCEYIYQNLNGDVSPEKMSEIAAFSKFHFHRVFVAYTGTSLAKFVLLARLKRAS